MPIFVIGFVKTSPWKNLYNQSQFIYKINTDNSMYFLVTHFLFLRIVEMFIWQIYVSSNRLKTKDF